MVKSPCCEKTGLKKGPWTPEEDQKLLMFIEEHGHGSWRALPARAGLLRCGKSCRLRWINYLRPDIKRGKFSVQEEQTIIQLHALLGNRWSGIATHLPKRTDNEIKNYWNTHLKKRLTKMGIDPTTHRPKIHTVGCGTGQVKDAANLSHMAQWESARLEAEARLVRESKFITTTNPLQLGSTSYEQIMNNNILEPPSLPPCLDILKAWQRTWTSKTSTESSHSLLGAVSFPEDDLESPTSMLNFSTTPQLQIPMMDYPNLVTCRNQIPSTAWISNNMVDGPPDTLVYDPTEPGSAMVVESGNFEEQGYWSSILNMVNTSPSNSPIF